MRQGYEDDVKSYLLIAGERVALKVLLALG